jgi:hypothetical protein
LNILFDLGQFANTFSENAADQGIRIEDACISIDPDAARTPKGHAFSLTINGQQKVGWIAWSPVKRAYAITSKQLERTKQVDDRRVTLVRRLTQKQPFRIIPATPGVVYAYGDFYSTDLKLGGKQGAGRAILDLLETIPALAELKSEKGHFDGYAPSRPDDSVFGFADRNLVAGTAARVFGERFRFLVCDDLRDETADFNALDDDRLVLIHAKASPKRDLYRASALQDVFSQGFWDDIISRLIPKPRSCQCRGAPGLRRAGIQHFPALSAKSLSRIRPRRRCVGGDQAGPTTCRSAVSG